MPAQVTVQVSEGPLKGKVFSFDEHDTFIFGRAPDCHARLPEDDRTVSRHHFILEVNPPDACVRDLGSLNGTYVNDRKHGGREGRESPEEAAKRRFPQVDLHDGDVIRAGATSFSVHVRIPVLCEGCGKEIEPREAGQARPDSRLSRLVLCQQCRAKPARAVTPISRPEPIRCQQCGKDVSEEVGEGRHGAYVCRDCRDKAEADPVAVLLKALQDAHRVAGQQGPLDLPGYEIERMLGKGAMGAVYLAGRKKDKAKVAIKVMLSRVAVSDQARKQFLREIEVMRDLRHRNCVELYDHGSSGSGFYFVMEYCPGGSVAQLMERRGGKLTLKEAGPIILQALDGLAHAHQKDFVHRDIKPQNLLLTRDEGGVTKVSDFGLSKNFQKAGFSGMTFSGQVGGTAPFMPREQVVNFRFVKPATDLWSIGATMYHLLTGQFPREFCRGEDPIEVILRGGIVPIRDRDPAIPKKVTQVIDRALAEDLSARYQTAVEMRRDLEAAL